MHKLCHVASIDSASKHFEVSISVLCDCAKLSHVNAFIFIKMQGFSNRAVNGGSCLQDPRDW